MTPKNKVARAIETSPNIRSQICSKNRWNKFLFLLSSSYRIISLNGFYHLQIREQSNLAHRKVALSRKKKWNRLLSALLLLLGTCRQALRTSRRRPQQTQ
jgi:hypothetical protein